MTTKIVFIEFLDELKYLEELEEEEIVVVTTQPTVKVKLKGRKIRCIDTQELFGRRGHQEVVEATAAIVNGIRPCFSVLSQGSVKYAHERTAIFYLRFFLNYLFSHIYLVHAAVKEVNPDEIIVLPFESFKQVEARLNKAGSLLGNIVELYSKANNIKSVRIYDKSVKRDKKLRYFFYQRLETSVFKLMLFWLRRVRNNKEILLAPNDTCGMPVLLKLASKEIKRSFPIYLSIQRGSIRVRVMEMISGKSFSLVSLPTISTKRERSHFEKLWSTCMDDIQLYLKIHATNFDFHGIDVSQYIIDYMAYGLASELKDLNGKICSLFQVLHEIHPAVVFSQHALGVSYALGEICRERKIPAILVSHGSHVPHQQKYSEIEWNEHARTLFNTHFPFVAIQTSWAGRFFEAQKKALSVPVNTGPLLFAQKSRLKENREQLRKRIYKQYANDRILIHAGTPKSWRSFRPWIYETLDEYIHNINKIIQAVDKVRGVYLAIRFRPVGGITSNDFKKMLMKSDCYGIYDKGSFDEHLLSADMLISYSSTTLEEALQNKIPVLQFDPDNKYWHIPSNFFRNSNIGNQPAVQCASNYQELCKVIKNFEKKIDAKIDESEWKEHILDMDDRWLQKVRSI